MAQAEADSAPVLSLRLNVAARRLDVLAEGLRDVSYPVAVGARAYPTPRGDFKVTAVEWNPWWIPPAREWARGEHRTPPGPDNPMGRVKLYLRSFYFLHGTPLEESIGTATSHGCIRLRNADAIALAIRLMIAGKSGLDSAEVTAVAADSSTTTWLLERPIPVTIDYETIEWERDSLRLHPDLYALKRTATVDSVLALLKGRGLEAERIDTASVRRAVAASRRGSVSLRATDLLRQP